MILGHNPDLTSLCSTLRSRQPVSAPVKRRTFWDAAPLIVCEHGISPSNLDNASGTEFIYTYAIEERPTRFPPKLPYLDMHSTVYYFYSTSRSGHYEVATGSISPFKLLSVAALVKKIRHPGVGGPPAT